MTPAERLREIAKLADSWPAADYATGEVLAKIVHDAHALADYLDGRVVVEPILREFRFGRIPDGWSADLPETPPHPKGTTPEAATEALQVAIDQRDGRVMP